MKTTFKSADLKMSILSNVCRCWLAMPPVAESDRDPGTRVSVNNLFHKIININIIWKLISNMEIFKLVYFLFVQLQSVLLHIKSHSPYSICILGICKESLSSIKVCTDARRIYSNNIRYNIVLYI